MYGNGMDQKHHHVIETDFVLGSFSVKDLFFLSESNIFPLIFIYVCVSLIIFKCL